MTGPSTQTLTPVPGLACILRVRLSGLGRASRGAGPGGVGWMGLTPSCSAAGSLSSRFSEPAVDQGPGAGIPSALVLISIV